MAGGVSVEWSPVEEEGRGFIGLGGRRSDKPPCPNAVYVGLGSYLEGLLVGRAMSEPASRPRSDRNGKPAAAVRSGVRRKRR